MQEKLLRALRYAKRCRLPIRFDYAHRPCVVQRCRRRGRGLPLACGQVRKRLWALLAATRAGGSEYPSRYATDRQRDRVIAPDFLELASASWPATQVLGVVDLQ
jgi:hypothetical protein